MLRDSRKSTRAKPAASIARNASTARRRTSAVCVSSSGGRDEHRRLLEILRLVVVELARRQDLARDRRLGIVVAEDRALDLARVGHRGLDDDLAVELRGERHRRAKLRRRLGLRDPDARPEVRRLDEHRDSPGAPRSAPRSHRATPPTLPRSTTRCATIGSPRAAKHTFIIALSIPTAEASTPAPTYGTSASSSSPCTVPSSPYGPWSTGKMTSRPSPATYAFSRAGRVAGRPLEREERLLAGVREPGRPRVPPRPARPDSCRAFVITSAAAIVVGGRSGIVQRPSRSIADRNRLVPLPVEVRDDRGRRRERHLVLARPAAVDHADAKLLHVCRCPFPPCRGVETSGDPKAGCRAVVRPLAARRACHAVATPCGSEGGPKPSLYPNARDFRFRGHPRVRRRAPRRDDHRARRRPDARVHARRHAGRRQGGAPAGPARAWARRSCSPTPTTCISGPATTGSRGSAGLHRLHRRGTARS